jgi:phosphotransferase system IIB component
MSSYNRPQGRGLVLANNCITRARLALKQLIRVNQAEEHELSG